MQPYRRPAMIVDGPDRLLCPAPLKINTMRGCYGHCKYCSMSSQHARWASRAKGEITEVAPSPIKYIDRIFYRSAGMERQLIDARYPLQIGHASDPCQPAERPHHILEKTLRILQDFDFPTIITTKFPNLLTEDPYLRQLLEIPAVVQCSISTEDQAMLHVLEPNAPSWKRRIAALSTLHEAGVTPILRLWPFIPDLCGNLQILLEAAYDAGVRTVQANFLKLFNAGRDVARFRDVLGYDYAKESRLGYEQRHNFKIPNLAVQRAEIMQLEEICREIGLECLTCDDLTGTRNWRSCCGTEGVSGFKAAPWAFYVRGGKITSHTSYEEYMYGIDCPWAEEFEMLWNRGKLAKAVPGIVFHENDCSYSRIGA